MSHNQMNADSIQRRTWLVRCYLYTFGVKFRLFRSLTDLKLSLIHDLTNKLAMHVSTFNHTHAHMYFSEMMIIRQISFALCLSKWFKLVVECNHIDIFCALLNMITFLIK